ncbi:hypothetical protein ACIA5D_40200 [Actinoplanes sp. NPDC051513]|uniref:hypothetical protein n=1 Tax=Actinoplanes sp. NPDC051513 TaxID=3363908 RepID=UPI0037A88B93
MSTTTETHPEPWWAEFEQHCDKFDAASVTEALGDAILPGIPSLLLRREGEIATEKVLRHLNRPGSPELAETAAAAAERLTVTVERISERSGSEGTEAAYALCRLLRGSWSRAAAEAEPLVGARPLVRAFIGALHLEPFGAELAQRLLNAGYTPATAVRSGVVLGRYSWWPSWLQEIVTERVLAGTLDHDTIAALKECAFAELSPTQARMARRLIKGEPQLVETTASRLDSLGEHPTATKLRGGDVRTVAFAARLIPV